MQAATTRSAADHLPRQLKGELPSNTAASPATTLLPRNPTPLHCGRQKYANPRDLPSYPSVGLRDDGAAASAAASLGWANKPALSIESWRPSSSASASAAAVLARDYKMAPAWEPERSSAGHRAAQLAAGSAQRQSQTSPRPQPSGWGNSAANVAFEAARASPSVAREDISKPTRRGSLHAARASVSSPRARSKSSSQIPEHDYPDRANAAANALSAATAAHRPSVRVPAEGAGATPYTTMSRQMYTSKPPVKLEVDEQQHADVLHASAMAMAKRMYVQQQKMVDSVKRAESQRSSSFSRPAGVTAAGAGAVDTADGNAPVRFNNLQEAAYRLAQERLAKLHDEHQKNRDFQEYYRSPNSPDQTSKIGSVRGKLSRRRSSSDSIVPGRRNQSLRYHRRVSTLNPKLESVDEQQRRRDREALLAAAQRNVRAQLSDMDQRVYVEKGRIPPRMLTEWELKAHDAAQARADELRDDDPDKIAIGAGGFVDRDEVDRIAAGNVRPLIDDMDKRAEAEREREMTARLDEERRKEEAQRDKARERELKEIQKRIQDEAKEGQKERVAEARQEEKARKDEEKAAKAEERAAKAEKKRLAKEEKRKSKEGAKPLAVDPGQGVPEEDGAPTPTPAPDHPSPRTPEPAHSPATGAAGPAPAPLGEEAEEAEEEEEGEEAAAAATQRGKMRAWLLSRFSRPRSKTSASAPDDNPTTSPAAKKTRGFVGGARLRRGTVGSSASAATEPPQLDGGSSAREVAMATATPAPLRRASGDGLAAAAEWPVPPPPPLPEVAGSRVSGNSVRESRFSEIIE